MSQVGEDGASAGWSRVRGRYGHRDTCWEDCRTIPSGTHTVDHYLSLGYPIELTPEQGGYFVRVPDLPGCESNGITAEDAMDSVHEAMAAWIEAAIETGRTIPPPRRDDSDYSGKFVVRVGRSLHRDLVRLAALEGMSLNAFVSAILSRAVGRHIGAALPHLDDATEFAADIEAARVELASGELVDPW